MFKLFNTSDNSSFSELGPSLSPSKSNDFTSFTKVFESWTLCLGALEIEGSLSVEALLKLEVWDKFGPLFGINILGECFVLCFLKFFWTFFSSFNDLLIKSCNFFSRFFL